MVDLLYRVHMPWTDFIAVGYRIEEESTSGWTIIDPTAVKLNKEQAKVLLEELINEGYKEGEGQNHEEDGLGVRDQFHR